MDPKPSLIFTQCVVSPTLLLQRSQYYDAKDKNLKLFHAETKTVEIYVEYLEK